jgi:hypothetical protein
MPTASDDVDLTREIERVADRLRVLGPRLAARLAARRTTREPVAAGPDDLGGPDDLVGSTEPVDARAIATIEQIRDVLQRLADLAADAEGRRRRPVPALAPHGLADQVLVLGHDLLAVCDPAARTAGLTALGELRHTL